MLPALHPNATSSGYDKAATSPVDQNVPNPAPAQAAEPAPASIFSRYTRSVKNAYGAYIKFTSDSTNFIRISFALCAWLCLCFVLALNRIKRMKVRREHTTYEEENSLKAAAWVSLAVFIPSTLLSFGSVVTVYYTLPYAKALRSSAAYVLVIFFQVFLIVCTAMQMTSMVAVDTPLADNFQVYVLAARFAYLLWIIYTLSIRSVACHRWFPRNVSVFVLVGYCITDAPMWMTFIYPEISERYSIYSKAFRFFWLALMQYYNFRFELYMYRSCSTACTTSNQEKYLAAPIPDRDFEQAMSRSPKGSGKYNSDDNLRQFLESQIINDSAVAKLPAAAGDSHDESIPPEEPENSQTMKTGVRMYEVYALIICIFSQLASMVLIVVAVMSPETKLFSKNTSGQFMETYFIIEHFVMICAETLAAFFLFSLAKKLNVKLSYYTIEAQTRMRLLNEIAPLYLLQQLNHTGVMHQGKNSASKSVDDASSHKKGNLYVPKNGTVGSTVRGEQGPGAAGGEAEVADVIVSFEDIFDIATFAESEVGKGANFAEPVYVRGGKEISYMVRWDVLQTPKYGDHGDHVHLEEGQQHKEDIDLQSDIADDIYAKIVSLSESETFPNSSSTTIAPDNMQTSSSLRTADVDFDDEETDDYRVETHYNLDCWSNFMYELWNGKQVWQKACMRRFFSSAFIKIYTEKLFCAIVLGTFTVNVIPLTLMHYNHSDNHRCNAVIELAHDRNYHVLQSCLIACTSYCIIIQSLIVPFALYLRKGVGGGGQENLVRIVLRILVAFMMFEAIFLCFLVLDMYAIHPSNEDPLAESSIFKYTDMIADFLFVCCLYIGNQSQPMHFRDKPVFTIICIQSVCSTCRTFSFLCAETNLGIDHPLTHSFRITSQILRMLVHIMYLRYSAEFEVYFFWKLYKYWKNRAALKVEASAGNGKAGSDAVSIELTNAESKKLKNSISTMDPNTTHDTSARGVAKPRGDEPNGMLAIIKRALQNNVLELSVFDVVTEVLVVITFAHIFVSNHLIVANVCEKTASKTKFLLIFICVTIAVFQPVIIQFVYSVYSCAESDYENANAEMRSRISLVNALLPQHLAQRVLTNKLTLRGLGNASQLQRYTRHFPHTQFPINTGIKGMKLGKTKEIAGGIESPHTIDTRDSLSLGSGEYISDISIRSEEEGDDEEQD